jgi:ribosomal protein S20
VNPQPAPDTVEIGELTAGGAANPQAQQAAADLVASIEKRLNGLSAQTVRRQRTQVSRIRNFWQQAQAALSSGDVEGAKTLATKANLLLDDLQKQGSGGV